MSWAANRLPSSACSRKLSELVSPPWVWALRIKTRRSIKSMSKSKRAWVVVRHSFVLRASSLFWPLTSDFRIRCSAFGVGCLLAVSPHEWMQDAGSWILDAGFWIPLLAPCFLLIERWTLSVERLLRLRHSTFDVRCLLNCVLFANGQSRRGDWRLILLADPSRKT